MNDKSSAFGADPEQIDKLLAWPLDEDMDEIPNASLDRFAEGPGSQIGHYRLLSVLGEGGMGIVYLAQQEEPVKREIALKIIKPGMDSKRVIARFEAEQQALALMQHPYIAHVYDVGLTLSGRSYFVMEYVEGVPITEYCDNTKLTIEARLQLFLHVCEAVQHAHQKGVIHRDIKPSNILVITQDDQAVPKIIDFGVAKAINQPLTDRAFSTEEGQLVGTPEYMSPEQANLGNQDIDTRSDIYSLGVILYKLLTGMLPFDPETFREGGIDHICKIIREEEPKTPSTRLSTISDAESTEIALHRQTDLRALRRKLKGDLDWITLKALDKDRSRRYGNADSFAEDIRKYLKHEPVSAVPPGFVYVTKKFIRRHRTAVISITALVVLIISIVLSVEMYIKARRADWHAQSLEHNSRLAEAQELYANRQYAQTSSHLESLLESEHVGRQARLLHAQALIELDGAASAVSELEGLLEEPDAIAGRAHFLLAKILYESQTGSSITDDKNHAEWEYHRQQAEKLVPDIANYYFLRKQTEFAARKKLELLRLTVQLDPSGLFGEPVNAGPMVNSPNMEMTPSISADGLSLYFCSDRPEGEGRWDIWLATRTSTSDEWSAASNVGPPVNTSAMEWFPSISADGLELYFCRGDWGQGDIYVATRHSPQEPWQSAVRLSDAINVAADDYAPLISFDGLSLYFISKRPGGPGDIDMWITKRPTLDAEWGCPEPLPTPINSPHKEGHKCVSADGLMLFFQRIKGNEANKFLYVTIRDTKADPWSQPINLGPMPVPGSSIPAISSLSCDGTELYFCDHPFFEPQPGGQGQSDIWYMPINVLPQVEK
jgi:serine/threonine protein kinase